jgi:hypothetical protein
MTYIFFNDWKERDLLFAEVDARFKLKDLGEIQQCLGMRIQRDKENGTIYIDQKQYVEIVLAKFGLSDCMSVATPVETSFGTMLESESKNSNADVPYQSVVGSLIYLAVNTCSDIAYVTSVLSQYNTAYNKEHWKYARHVLWYLKGSIDYCLQYRKCDPG